jgi:hypothetical protein
VASTFQARCAPHVLILLATSILKISVRVLCAPKEEIAATKRKTWKKSRKVGYMSAERLRSCPSYDQVKRKREIGKSLANVFEETRLSVDRSRRNR